MASWPTLTLPPGVRLRRTAVKSNSRPKAPPPLPAPPRTNMRLSRQHSLEHNAQTERQIDKEKESTIPCDDSDKSSSLVLQIVPAGASLPWKPSLTTYSADGLKAKNPAPPHMQRNAILALHCAACQQLDHHITPARSHAGGRRMRLSLAQKQATANVPAPPDLCGHTLQSAITNYSPQDFLREAGDGGNSAIQRRPWLLLLLLLLLPNGWFAPTQHAWCRCRLRRC